MNLLKEIKDDPDSESMAILMPHDIEGMFEELAEIENLPAEVTLIILETLGEGYSRAARWQRR
jgi:hypothetical protein